MNASQGQTGADVIAVQQALAGVGFPVVADGRYGPKTTAAVQQFQEIQGLPTTGAVDDVTWGALQNVLGQRIYASSLLPTSPVVAAPAPQTSSVGFPSWLTTPAMLTFLAVASIWLLVKWRED